MNQRPIDQSVAAREAEHALVAEILSGSVAAWQRFVVRYSALIHSVLRRYLFDEDELRNAYLDTLERLYGGGLRTFKTPAALSTWLVVVTRNAAIDRIRKSKGRQRIPASIAGMDPLTREVFMLYYLKGLDFETVRHWARPQVSPLATEELSAILDRIERRVDRRTLRRLAYAKGSPSMRQTNGFLLELLTSLNASAQPETPEAALIRKEAERTSARIQTLLAELPDPEGRILEMRFRDRMSAKQIASALELESPRRAYTLIDRALRRAREAITRSISAS